jgi:hypothetical protein
MCYRRLDGHCLGHFYIYVFFQNKAYILDTHAHVQRLLSVVKMSTMREECITENQLSVVRNRNQCKRYS